MPHLSQEEWSRAVAAMGPKEAEKWRSTRNIFVDGLPPPPYTGPLSTGGSAGVRPTPVTAAAPSATVAPTQGPTKVDETDDISEFGGFMSGVDPSQFTGPNSGAIIQKLMEQQRFDQGIQGAYAKQQQDAARARIEKRQYGPSRTEQLFRLAAAIGTPMIRPSFGGVMSNVMPELATMASARQKATQDREDALAALQQQSVEAAAARQGAGQKSMLELMRLYGALNKPKSLGAVVNTINGPVDPITGVTVVPPDAKVYTDLEDNPTPVNLQKLVDAYPRFEELLTKAYNRGIIKHGVR